MTRLLVLLLAACTSSRPLTVDGSSTLFPLAESLVERLRTDQPTLEVVATVSGSAAGIARLCRGEADVALSSRPMAIDERLACLDHQISPIGYAVARDAIAVVVHPANDFVSSLSLEELRRAWQPEAEGRALTWRAVRSDFPSRPIVLYGAGSFSGTFEVFTRAIVGHPRRSRADFIASEDDGVLLYGVANDPRALGFFSLAHHIRAPEKTKLVAVDFGNGPVLPTRESIDDGRYAPLSRTLEIYADERVRDVRPLVQRFLDASPLELEKAGLLPLDEDAKKAARARFGIP